MRPEDEALMAALDRQGRHFHGTREIEAAAEAHPLWRFYRGGGGHVAFALRRKVAILEAMIVEAGIKSLRERGLIPHIPSEVREREDEPWPFGMDGKS